MPPISAVIPNREGAPLLRQTLTALRRELSSGEDEILVVDDASEDESVALLRRDFPTVRVVALKEGIGFGRACNLGFAEAVNAHVLLLNSDMEVMPGSLSLLAEHFVDSVVFAAGPRYVAPGECTAPHDDGLGVVRPQLGSPAGGGLFRRDAFLELGGFDPLYHPFYWEDLDLGWQAWGSQHRIVRDARACFLHLESATIRKLYSAAYVQRIRTRNRCFFGWKNLESPPVARRFFAATLRLAAVDLLRRGSSSTLLGVLEATLKRPRALHARTAPGRRLTDTQILEAAGPTAQRLFAV